MALKRPDLYSSLWASCDELCAGMNASQYKDYVSLILFIKYITDKYGNNDLKQAMMQEQLTGRKRLV